MTANFRKPGLLYPSQSSLTLPSPAPFVAQFRTPNRRSTREYRRSLRAAEMAAWESATPSANTQLRAHAAEAGKVSPTEEWVFTVLLLLSLAGVVWGLSESARFVEGWQQFVALLQQLIG